MREIKFRAWDKDKKWMVYDVQNAYDGMWSDRNSDEINNYYSYVSTFQCFSDEERFNLMQYTGLKDKNGVEIYEGDIVKLGRVVYKVGYLDAGFKMISRGSVTRLSGHCEVIGNIHEGEDRE